MKHHKKPYTYLLNLTNSYIYWLAPIQRTAFKLKRLAYVLLYFCELKLPYEMHFFTSLDWRYAEKLAKRLGLEIGGQSGALRKKDKTMLFW